MALAADIRNTGSEQEILVCDDEVSFLRLMELTMGRAGFSVETASDGDEGLARIHHHIPDLLIVDLIMPRTDGFEMIAKVRDELGLHALPIIVLTALGEDSPAQVRAYEVGANLVLAKPVSMAHLVSAAQQMLAARHYEVI